MHSLPLPPIAHMEFSKPAKLRPRVQVFHDLRTFSDNETAQQMWRERYDQYLLDQAKRKAGANNAQ